VMPNHVHGIIRIMGDGKPVIDESVVWTGFEGGAGLEPARTEPARTEPTFTEPVHSEPIRMESEHAEPVREYSLSEIVRQFKTFSAKQINKSRNSTGAVVWQRNYYEHIIRDDNDLNRIREYIVNNPANWMDDPEKM
ncbi:MAG: transposase, partial [bacterium]